MKKIIVLWALSLLAVPTNEAQGREPYLVDDWRPIYPDSVSDDAECGLCHQDTLNGGSPWNQYGQAIREALERPDVANVAAAITLVENDHIDGDDANVTFLDEIKAGFQPGWKVGATNTLFSGDPSSPNENPGNTAPAAIASSALDFPDEVANPQNIVPADIGNTGITLELHMIASGLNAPVRAVRAPGIDGSLFVVEQTGKVKRVDLSTGQTSTFMDVGSDLIDLGVFGGDYDERGLLGLAFHPDYQENGLLYTYQSEPVRPSQDGDVDFVAVSNNSNRHRSMVVEYRASDPSCNSFVRKTRNVMILDQPQFNHNGGDMVFDSDGFLYISLGDGGGSNDQGPSHGPLGHGRNKENSIGQHFAY